MSSLPFTQFVSDARDLLPDENVLLPILATSTLSNIADRLLNFAGDRAKVTVCASDVSGQSNQNDARSSMLRRELVKRLAQPAYLSIRHCWSKLSNVSSPLLQTIGCNGEHFARPVMLSKIPSCLFEDIGDSKPNALAAFWNEQACKSLDSDPVRHSFCGGFLGESRSSLQLSTQLHDLNIETVHVKRPSSVCGNTTIAGRASAASRRPKAQISVRRAA